MSGRSARKSIRLIIPITKISVDISGASYTATEDITELEIENQGSKIVWWSSSSVDPANNLGVRLLPNTTRVFVNILKGFTIRFITVGADTSTIGGNELV